jgi:6-phosphogluconate dehydrogenase
MPTLAAALFARFSSRGAGNYAARVTAALRNQFGGHAVKAAPGAANAATRSKPRAASAGGRRGAR